MKKPFFSIVTCTHNSENYLKKNIQSVKNQTFRDYEHVFIDGHSKDKTLAMINEYKTHSPSGKVKLTLRRPLGISDAMNQGIKNCTGNYVIFLHSDDSLFNARVLERAHTFLIGHEHPDWISGKINVIEENGLSVGIYPSRPIYKLLPKYIMKFYNLIPHQAVFMKRSVFRRFGDFDTRLTSSMDIDLWMRIWNKTKWQYWNTIVANYMVRKGAQSSGIKNKTENDKNILKVKKRYLNGFELFLFKVVKQLTGNYNRTRR